VTVESFESGKKIQLDAQQRSMFLKEFYRVTKEPSERLWKKVGPDCAVTLKYADGFTETYHLLGGRGQFLHDFQSDPDRLWQFWIGQWIFEEWLHWPDK